MFYVHVRHQADKGALRLWRDSTAFCGVQSRTKREIGNQSIRQPADQRRVPLRSRISTYRPAACNGNGASKKPPSLLWLLPFTALTPAGYTVPVAPPASAEADQLP